MRSFRLILRENTMNSLVMIQPALLLGPQGPRQLIKALEMLNLRTDVSWGVYEEGSMETSTSQAQHHLDNQAFFFWDRFDRLRCKHTIPGLSFIAQMLQRQYSFDEGPPQPVLLDATSLKSGSLRCPSSFRCWGHPNDESNKTGRNWRLKCKNC